MRKLQPEIVENLPVRTRSRRVRGDAGATASTSKEIGRNLRAPTLPPGVDEDPTTAKQIVEPDPHGREGDLDRLPRRDDRAPVSSTLLIANTIRLSIFSRRREIEVMKLVGATNWFVRGPFMLEGLICGVLGSVAAIVLLLIGKESCSSGSPTSFDAGADVQALVVLADRADPDPRRPRASARSAPDMHRSAASSRSSPGSGYARREHRGRQKRPSRGRATPPHERDALCRAPRRARDRPAVRGAPSPRRWSPTSARPTPARRMTHSSSSPRAARRLRRPAADARPGGAPPARRRARRQSTSASSPARSGSTSARRSSAARRRWRRSPARCSCSTRCSGPTTTSAARPGRGCCSPASTGTSCCSARSRRCRSCRHAFPDAEISFFERKAPLDWTGAVSFRACSPARSSSRSAAARCSRSPAS